MTHPFGEVPQETTSSAEALYNDTYAAVIRTAISAGLTLSDRDVHNRVIDDLHEMATHEQPTQVAQSSVETYDATSYIPINPEELGEWTWPMKTSVSRGVGNSYGGTH